MAFYVISKNVIDWLSDAGVQPTQVDRDNRDIRERYVFNEECVQDEDKGSELPSSRSVPRRRRERHFRRTNDRRVA
jgi:hypothetical protein